MSDASDLQDLLYQAARRAGGSPAILAPGREPLTHEGLRRQAGRVREALRAWGLGPSARVAMALPDGPETAAAVLTVACGAACAPLNPGYQAEEFERYLRQLRAQALIVPAAGGESAREGARRAGVPVLELLPEPAQPAGVFGLRAAAGLQRAAGAPSDDKAAALLLLTSGTTSDPKVVPLTHANLRASARNVAAALKLGPEDCGLVVMPLYHIHGIVGGLLSAVAASGSAICPGVFTAAKAVELIETAGPTWYTAAPAIHRMILGRAQRLRRPISHRLRVIRSTSAALAGDVAAALEGLFGVPLLDSYGMTEAAQQIACNPLPPGARKAGSVGLAAGPSVAVVDGQGRPLKAGETGEVVIRGDNVMGGYDGMAERRSADFFGDWFRTGDLGYLDEDGYLFLVGRLKELINRGGEKVSPFEIEAALLSHPQVAQAAAFPVPDESLGEDVGAAVVLKEAAGADEAALLDFVTARLAPFKVPHFLKIVESIPAGPTGKIQRARLARQLALVP